MKTNSFFIFAAGLMASLAGCSGTFILGVNDDTEKSDAGGQSGEGQNGGQGGGGVGGQGGSGAGGQGGSDPLVGGTGGGSCADASWGQFTVLNWVTEDGIFSPPGCSRNSGEGGLRIAGRMTDATHLEVQVRHADDSPFSVALMQLFVGEGPDCSIPIENAVKKQGISVLGETSQVMTLEINPYNPPSGWPLGQIKQFWVAVGELEGSGDFVASPMLLVQRYCVP